jgi:hypothetical protein
MIGGRSDRLQLVSTNYVLRRLCLSSLQVEGERLAYRLLSKLSHRQRGKIGMIACLTEYKGESVKLERRGYGHTHRVGPVIAVYVNVT